MHLAFVEKGILKIASGVVIADDPAVLVVNIKGLTGGVAVDSTKIMHFAASVEKRVNIAASDLGLTDDLAINIDGKAIAAVTTEGTKINHTTTTIEKGMRSTGCGSGNASDLAEIIDANGNTIVATFVCLISGTRPQPERDPQPSYT